MGALFLKRFAGQLAATTAITGVLIGTAEAQRTILLPPVDVVTSTRLNTGITGIGAGFGIAGTSTTVITAQEIERSPVQTLPEILSREPGVQVRSLFGAVNSALSTVDIRGFGATGTSNTLVLVNGRRLNDVDMAGVRLQCHSSRQHRTSSRSRAVTAARCSMVTARSAA